jgi:hypothetical protein
MGDGLTATVRVKNGDTCPVIHLLCLCRGEGASGLSWTLGWGSLVWQGRQASSSQASPAINSQVYFTLFFVGDSPLQFIKPTYLRSIRC